MLYYKLNSRHSLLKTANGSPDTIHTWSERGHTTGILEEHNKENKSTRETIRSQEHIKLSIRRTHTSDHPKKANHSAPNKSIVAGYPAVASPPLPSNCTPRQYRRSCVSHNGVKAQGCNFINSPPPSNPPVNESRSAEDGTRGGKKPEDATLGAIVLVSTIMDASGEVVKP